MFATQKSLSEGFKSTVTSYLTTVLSFLFASFPAFARSNGRSSISSSSSEKGVITNVAALKRLVQSGKVYVQDDFIDAELLAELRADMDSAREQGLFAASGLSNFANVNQSFGGNDRQVAPVLRGSYSSPALLKMERKINTLRQELAMALNRPTMLQDELGHESYYSRSSPGATLKRHTDERHEELKGRKGWTSTSRRSISYLIYLSDADWDAQRNGGELRAFPVSAKYKVVNGNIGGEDPRGNNLQVAWLLNKEAHEVEPVYMDGFSPVQSQKSGQVEPACVLYTRGRLFGRMRRSISNFFEMRDPSTGIFNDDLSTHLKPEFRSGGFELLRIEDIYAWNRNELPAGSEVHDVNPIGARLVLFDSVILPHEVRETKTGVRLALAGWFHERVPAIPSWV